MSFSSAHCGMCPHAWQSDKKASAALPFFLSALMLCICCIRHCIENKASALAYSNVRVSTCTQTPKITLPRLRNNHNVRKVTLCVICKKQRHLQWATARECGGVEEHVKCATKSTIPYTEPKKYSEPHCVFLFNLFLQRAHTNNLHTCVWAHMNKHNTHILHA